MKVARAALALGVALLATAAGAAQEQKVQSVGVAPIANDAAAPRDSALRAAVRNAVADAAAAMLPGDYAPPASPPDQADREPNAWLANKLGEDPYAFVTRFRIVEDRGRRPAMFSADRSVEFEYVVVAEVTLDLDAIRAKMEKLGLAQRSARGPARAVTIVVEGLTSYPPLALVRKTLERDRGVRSVLPVEFTPGRAVLSVDADQDASGLVDSLTRRAPEGLTVVKIDQGPDRATVRVEYAPPAPAPAAAPTAPKPPAD